MKKNLDYDPKVAIALYDDIMHKFSEAPLAELQCAVGIIQARLCLHTPDPHDEMEKLKRNLDMALNTLLEYR
jgi:hypothetical protein